MVESGDHRPEERGLNEKLLDAFVFVPAGLALSVVEELPHLAARGRERLGVRVSSARAVGQLVVKAGHHELVRRSGGWLRRPGSAPPGTGGAGPSMRAQPGPPRSGGVGSSVGTAATGGLVGSPGGGGPPGTAAVNGHVPPVTTLSIPGFDTLSASQVVQRLDGLNRSELVSVRAYEASTRRRRTILNRVDQLLDQRS